MRNIRLSLFFCLFAAMSLVVAASAQTNTEKTHKNKYQNIEVTRFEVEAGNEVPPEYLDELAKDIANQLRDTRKFKQVIAIGETATDTSAPTLRLSGTITKFKKGSRAKRYLVGFGAGATRMVVHVKFADASTGETLFEDDVDGKVFIGLFGGDSKGATNGVAKDIGKAAKKEFF
jgi:hypothetical protein